MPRSHSFNHKWRAVLVAVAIVLLVCAGFEASAQQKKRRGKPAKTPTTQQTDSNSNAATTTTTTPPKPQKKNLAPLRGSESAAGGRATITSDAPLNDYEAYRSGNRYYVVIPQANAPSAPGGLRGRGYDDVQVHKRGNDTVLSFRLKPGTTAHVNQKFNRLEVVFNSPGDTSSTPGTTTTANTGTQSGTTGTTTATGNANNSRTGTQTGVTNTQNGNAAATTGGTSSNVPKPGGTPGVNTASTSASPAPVGSTPPIAAVPSGTESLPSVTPALGPSVEGSPVAPSPTPSAEQIAQTQPAPSIPTAVTTTQPATTGTSLGAVLKSNWLLVLIAALLLITIGLVAMTRSRARRSEAAALDERETPAIEEGSLESVEAAPVREAPVLETVAAAEAVDAAVALESPDAPDEAQTLEVEPVEALNVEQVRLEIKHVLTGQEYDESIINTPIRETRQLIESELLFALSKRNTERRERALKAFTEHGYFDDATRDLRTAQVPAERAAAARKLGLTRDTAATPHLSAALEDTAPEVRRAAVEALAESRDPEAIGALESLLAREEDRKVPHALIQRAIRASAAAATAAGIAAAQEEPPATIDVETETPEEAVTAEAAPVAVEETATPAEEAAPIEALDETPGVVEESLAGVPESSVSPETTPSTIEATPAATLDTDAPRAEAGMDSSPGALPLAAALVAGLATAEAGAAERQRAEADAARIHAEQERRRAEEEARRREAEEERQRQEQERLRAEEERRRIEEEARRKEEERQRLEQQRLEEERQRAEEERQRAEAEAQRQREAAEAERIRAEEERARAEEERVRAEAEVRRQAEEERKQVEKEARLKAFEEERQRAEEARRLRAEERERRRAEEERARLEEQERERAEAEAARRRAEEAALRLADMRRRAEEEARQREEAEAARLLEEETARQRAEEEAARKLAEKEEAEARQREAQELERQRAAEARRLEEEERHRRLEQERLRAEEERRRTEEEARRKEEERVRVEAEARRHAEEERRRIEEEERQRAEAEAARLQFEHEAAERRRREEEEAAAAAEATTHLEVEEVEPVEAQADTPVVQSELFESTIADQASFMPPLETSKGIVERSPSDWIEVDYNEPEAIGDEQSIADAAPVVVDEAAIVEHTGAETPPVESIEEYGAREQVKDIELATPGHGGATYPDDDFASVPGGILRRLGSEVASERAAAVTDLARVGGEDAFREISASFDDPAQLVRDAAARALFDLQADHAASFTRALREAPSDRRRRIGNALASSGLATEAIGHLMGESREKTYDAFSLLFLMSKAGEVQPLMRAIEEHPNSEVRLAVVKLLALSGQQDILPAFRRLAVRGSLPTEVRSAVMEAIYQISSQASSDTSPVA